MVGNAGAVQRHLGEGPSLDALVKAKVVYVDDLLDGQAWTSFACEVATLGVRSVLALPFSANGSPGVLSLYGTYPDAFGALDRARALIMAALAGLPAAFTASSSVSRSLVLRRARASSSGS